MAAQYSTSSRGRTRSFAQDSALTHGQVPPGFEEKTKKHSHLMQREASLSPDCGGFQAPPLHPETANMPCTSW